MKNEYLNYVKILGNETTWKENALIFLNYMLSTNAVADYSECEFSYPKKYENDGKELYSYLKENKINLKTISPEISVEPCESGEPDNSENSSNFDNYDNLHDEFISFKFKKYKLAALCAKVPEPQELNSIHSWSALFEDGKILISPYF